MEDLKNDLSVDETIVFQVRHSQVTLCRPAAAALAGVAVWLALITLVDPLRRGWFLFLGLLAMAGLAAWVAVRILGWSRAFLVLTDRRLVYSSGAFSRHLREVALSRVSEVSVFQSFPERLLGFGEVLVETGGDSPDRFPYFGMPRPEKLKKQILEQAHEARSASGDSGSIAREVVHAINRNQPTGEIPAVPPEKAPFYSEIVDQIERLDRLRERGSLSDEEFQRAKAALLKRLDGGS